ncbi:hypothetical protein AB8810_20420 [Xanthomonas sp. NCPPB 3005]|uniref:hypothetical protein n=1 Tax=Xanthomonas sp. NCPPB 3005 TaxID=3240913 RepID=UPI0035160D1F
MAHDLTVDAVRTALGVSKLKAEVAGWNIVNASASSATRFVVDDTEAARLLEAAAGATPQDVAGLLHDPAKGSLVVVNERNDLPQASLDELVADSVSAGLNYQALTESLSRHFGLMRLAITGRS